MKKLLSIILALLIIVSGVHLTIATHYCGGSFEGFKVSVSGEKAGCGMEASAWACHDLKTIGHNCCTDRMASYIITDNFISTVFQLIKVAQSNFHFLFEIPNILIHHSPYLIMQIAHFPPGKCLPNLVKLASICVFRK